MAQKSQTKVNGGGTPPENVKFHYLKSTHFRTIHADGAIGSVTPRGHIHMAIYNERHAIPREMVQEIKPDGTLGEVIQSETVVREGIVREMEVDVLMNVEVAKGVINWLEDKIKLIEKEIIKSSKE